MDKMRKVKKVITAQETVVVRSRNWGKNSKLNFFTRLSRLFWDSPQKADKVPGILQHSKCETRSS
jgi:hypothetical protein